jgi:hypothetical protein
MNASNTPTRTFSLIRRWLALALCGSLLLCGTRALADWPENNTNAAKWFQFPDRSSAGYDILSGTPPGGTGLPIILADDFQCTQTGPITDIHIWASWLGVGAQTSANVPPIPITLGIWSDVPAVTNATGRVPSHPGLLLWSQIFGAADYRARPVASVPNGETFWDPDPAPAGIILGTEFLIWQYNFYPTNPFVQQFGTNYWLSVTAGTAQTGTTQPLFGWKTTATNHWNDDAVFGHVEPATGQAVGDWKELIDPKSPVARSLDFSFVLTTPHILTNPPPPPPAPAKWLQPPDLDQGYDIAATLPYVVADDFLCTNASTITNIQIWSSFLGNQVDTNLTFTLAIWSDSVPPSPSTTPVPNYSRPGTLLWTETFTPGHYSSSFYASGQEKFYVPATGQLGTDTQVYLYSFTPVRPFCQRGSTNNAMVYWLSVWAKPSIAGTSLQYGWKTSTKHFRDDAVWGTVTASGSYVGNWKELFTPPGTTPQRSLDMAFQLNEGPPTPDCDPTIRPKWLQLPDTSPNGLDVLATGTNIVGDDFLCRTPGPISGITIWGSWLNDLVDTNATFVLRLWTDAPGIPGTPTNYSHPGALLCTTTFSSPQTVGTSLERYNYRLYADKLTENFYQPDKGTAGFIGRDTQIWQYDFYPFQPGCWVQQGSPLRAPLTYWVTINYVPAAGGNQYLFGAKTSVPHLLDDAVYGHLNSNLNPLGDWVHLLDPRSTNSLDLAHALYTFPVHGINKDLVNNTTATATGLQIVVAGAHVVTWHYDGSPAWPVFQVSYMGGNTVLQWSGLSLPPGGPTHVGFEMAATANPVILSMHWMLGNTLLLPPAKQANFHWLNNGTLIVVANNMISAPLQLSGGKVEWHTNAVALDQMTANGQRNPIGSAALQLPTDPILAGGSAVLQLPSPPSGAMYELIIVVLTDPAGGPGTTDYLLMPLDAALMPQIGGATVGGPNVNIIWSAIPGRTYRIQSKSALNLPWDDSGLGDIMAVDGEMNAMVPIMGTQGFYRVYLMPE